MSTRTTALLASGCFVLVALLVGALSERRGISENLAQPPSSYLAGPGGVSALAEALTRTGVQVSRLRRPWRTFGDSSGVRGSLLVVLAPSMGIGDRDAARFVQRSLKVGPVLAAGASAEVLLRCWGWGALSRGRDSIRVKVPGSTLAADAGWVRHVLVPSTREPDSTKVSVDDDERAHCDPVSGVTDTLLVTAGGRPVLVRVTPKKGYPAYLLSEASLLDNRSLRRTAAGPFALAFFREAGTGVVFDEYHHGFDDSGNLFHALIAWSFRSPWGWAAWQGALVGLLALFAAMARTGPIRAAIVRARRSSLEHVRALATALQSARGHDVAVELLVRGLRRRLSRDGRPGREPVTAWIDSLAFRLRSTRARDAAVRLKALTRPQRSVDDVLAAAHAVEDVWQELRP